MKSRTLLALLAAATAAAAAPAAAQTDTIDACYIPNTGNVYVVGEPNTHPACVSPNHVPFSWLSTDIGAGGPYLMRLRAGSPPGDRFVVDTAGGVVASGQIGIGTIPASGAGWRMMWYPYKSAFRAGYADAGGQWDDNNVGFYSWAGGALNVASGVYAFAMGNQNRAEAQCAVALGSGNRVFGSGGDFGTCGVAMGLNNSVRDFAGVALGQNSSSDGDVAFALGARTTADADYSMAFGYRASTNGHTGAKVFGDASTTDSIEAVANNEFAVRAAGGYRLFTNATLTAGVTLSAGGSAWNVVSDRTRKENFVSVDGEEVLARLRGVPVETWNYIAEGRQVRHMGPMAQDWHRAFGFNADDRTINSADFDGVNLAAVKALDARTAELREKAAEVDRLRAEVGSLRDSNAALERRMAELEAMVRQLAAQK